MDYPPQRDASMLFKDWQKYAGPPIVAPLELNVCSPWSGPFGMCHCRQSSIIYRNKKNITIVTHGENCEEADGESERKLTTIPINQYVCLEYMVESKNTTIPMSEEILTHEDEIFALSTVKKIRLDRLLIIDAQSGPPHPEDLTEAIKSKTTKIFRVINVFPSGMISLRSHSQLKEYVLMDNILQKYYKIHPLLDNFLSRSDLVKKGYYVAKLGDRYERCQFIKFIPPKEDTGFDLRIRLLDYGVPLVVPSDVIKPMHQYFKTLPSQGFTAAIYDPETKTKNTTDEDADNELIREQLQDKICETIVYSVDKTFPECPHIYCEFVSEVDE